MKNIPYEEVEAKVKKIHDKYCKYYNEPTPPAFTKKELAIFDYALRWIIENKHWNAIPDLFGTCSLYRSDFCQKAYLQCKHMIPADELYRVTVNVYAEDGFNFSRDIITELREHRPADYLQGLPDRLRICDPIVVYRVTSTPPSEVASVAEEISWWANPYAAFGAFEYKNKNGKAKQYHIYRAKIYKKDIIAYHPYLDEVMQLGSVQDVADVDLLSLHKICCLLELPYDRDLHNDFLDPMKVYHISLYDPKQIDKVRMEQNWTLDPRAAETIWKYLTYKERQECYVYEGSIYAHDVADYIPEEYEKVIQNGQVFDVDEIGPIVLGGRSKYWNEHALEREIKKQAERDAAIAYTRNILYNDEYKNAKQ